jgi:hypothetical protein
MKNSKFTHIELDDKIIPIEFGFLNAIIPYSHHYKNEDRLKYTGLNIGIVLFEKYFIENKIEKINEELFIVILCGENIRIPVEIHTWNLPTKFNEKIYGGPTYCLFGHIHPLMFDVIE